MPRTYLLVSQNHPSDRNEGFLTRTCEIPFKEALSLYNKFASTSSKVNEAILKTKPAGTTLFIGPAKRHYETILILWGEPESPKIEKKTVAKLSGWELLCILASWRYGVHNLTECQQDAIYRAIWAHSDGYGKTGMIPVQGYDWSGIRDSSEKAKLDMATAARNYLAKHNITFLEVEKLS